MVDAIEIGQNYKIALVGPGQSGQEIKMGLSLKLRSKAAERVWGIARAVMGEDFINLVHHGRINGMEATPKDALTELTKTPNTQVAIYADTIARWEALREAGKIPDEGFVATGFSLGRLAACTITGIIDVEDGMSLVKARGEAFYIVKGWLAALIGVDPEVTNIILRDGEQKVGSSTIYRSMINTPQQIVVGGEASAREDAKAWLESYDLEEKSDYVWVAVSGPFHTPTMAPARTSYGKALRKSKIGEPVRGILIGNNGRILKRPEDIIQDLLDQTTVTENFDAIGRTLYRLGVNTMICLSAKTAEANMLAQIAKAEGHQGIRTEILNLYSGDENPTFIAYQWKIAS